MIRMLTCKISHTKAWQSCPKDKIKCKIWNTVRKVCTRKRFGSICQSMGLCPNMLMLRIHSAWTVEQTRVSWICKFSSKDLTTWAWSFWEIRTRCWSWSAEPWSRWRSSGSMIQRKWNWNAEPRLTMKNSLTTTSSSKTLLDNSSSNFISMLISLWSRPTSRSKRGGDHQRRKTWIPQATQSSPAHHRTKMLANIIF